MTKPNTTPLMSMQQANLDFYLACCKMMVDAETNFVRVGLESMESLKLPKDADLGQPATLPWTLMQQQMRALQHMAECSMDLHKQVSSQAQQAVSQWQASASAAMQGSATPVAFDMSSNPMNEIMKKQMEAFMQLMTPGARR
ncbi:MAG: hypothetical protein RBT55_14885 [Rhodocyclaceae bacterium]|jgi:hypothetical protein|nr:hypothetical protein [Rhodocyclaceae bacterium]